LLEASRQAGVPQFLFVSSLDVYHEILPDHSLDETHPAWPASIYGAYKAAVELHLKSYHTTYGMNTSAWRPATMYSINPQLQKSIWFDMVKTIRDGGEVSTDEDGMLVHVEDVAEALALAVGDESVAGQFYNLVDCGMEWREVAEIAKDLSGSAAVIQNRLSRGTRRAFNQAKAIAFFDQHGNATALRRGKEGVAGYLAALLRELPPSHTLEQD
jgi:nucleoside-diphosphate-sugar epimerase